jgi:hypothetical protein
MADSDYTKRYRKLKPDYFSSLLIRVQNSFTQHWKPWEGQLHWYSNEGCLGYSNLPGDNQRRQD